MKIFFSYPHDANAPLVERIKADLEARGHEVWFDADQIKSGDDWRNAITRGILDSQQVVAFLSKHAVRDPGVCLNEIAIALADKGEAMVTVLVEPESEVSAPVSITHIQWLKMEDWQSRAQDAGWYRMQLDRLIDAIENPTHAGRNEELETLKLALDPMSFYAEIAPHIPGFIGRRWIIDCYNTWLTEEPNSRVLRIEGGPGLGKTAVASYLAHSTKNSVLAVHLCQYNKGESRNPLRLVRTLAYQLATRLPDYRARLLKSVAIQRQETMQGKDPASLWAEIISAPLAGGGKGNIDRQRLAIIIDGLDEATVEGKNPIVELLATEINQLPKWIGVVLTGRPDPELTQRLARYQPLVLRDDDPQNIADLKVYADEWLALEVRAGKLTQAQAQAACQALLDRSMGAFLYLSQARIAVAENMLDLTQPTLFPSGLTEIYLRFFERRFPDAWSDKGSYKAKVRPLLELVLASPEPLPISIASELLIWGSYDGPAVLKNLGSLLKRAKGGLGAEDEETIAPFHNSVREWLTDEDRAGADYLVDVSHGHRALADAGWSEFRRGVAGMRAYFVGHLPEHLAKTERTEDLHALLADTAYVTRAWTMNSLDILQYWGNLEDNTPHRMTSSYGTIIEHPANYDEQTVRTIAELLRDSCYPQQEMTLRQILLDRVRTKFVPAWIVTALLDLGRSERTVGCNEDALNHYLEAKTLADDSCLTPMVTDCGLEIADLYREASKYDKAEDALVPLVAQYREQGNWRSFARVVRSLMPVYRVEGKCIQALEVGELALQAFSEAVAPVAAAEIHLGLGAIYRLMYKRDLSRAHIMEGIRLIEAIPSAGRNRDTVSVYGELLLEYARQLQEADLVEDALQVRKRAFAAFEEIREYEKMRQAAGAIPAYYSSIGDHQQLLKWEQRQLQLALRSGRVRGIQVARHDVGFAHQLAGNYSEALREYDDCLKMSEATGSSAYATRGNIADIHRFTGKFSASIQIYQQLVGEAERDGISNNVARYHRLLFLSYFLRGDIAEADAYANRYLEWETQALVGFEEYPVTSAQMHSQLATMRAEEGNRVEASRVILQVQQLCPKLQSGQAKDYAIANVQIAMAWIIAGDLDAGEAVLTRYKAYWQPGNTNRSYGSYLLCLAELNVARERWHEAFEYAQHAYQIFCRWSSFHQATAALVMAKSELAEENLAESRRWLSLAEEKFAEYDQPQHLAESRVVAGQLAYAETGDVGRARDLIEGSSTTLKTMGWWRLARWADDVSQRIYGC